MNYEVGDKVKIREDLTKDKWYGDNFAVKHMMKYAGRIATIASDNGNRFGFQLDIDSGVCNWTPEMFDQNYNQLGTSSREAVEAISETFSNISKWGSYMKTSEFKAELKKWGCVFEYEFVTNKDNLVVAWISESCVNKIDSNYVSELSPKLFNLITKYAATPIAEREDEPKLFNVQITKGRWGLASWLYRNDDAISTSISADNDDLNQQWTLEQIEEYEIDDESVYKRVPVED